MDNETTTNCSETMTATSGNEDELENWSARAHLSNTSSQTELAPPSYKSATALDAGRLLASAHQLYPGSMSESGQSRPSEQQVLFSQQTMQPAGDGRHLGNADASNQGALDGRPIQPAEPSPSQAFVARLQMQTNKKDSKARSSISSSARSSNGVRDSNDTTYCMARRAYNDLRLSAGAGSQPIGADPHYHHHQSEATTTCSFTVKPGESATVAAAAAAASMIPDNNRYAVANQHWLHRTDQNQSAVFYGRAPINVIPSCSQLASAQSMVAWPQTNQCYRYMQPGAPGDRQPAPQQQQQQLNLRSSQALAGQAPWIARLDQAATREQLPRSISAQTTSVAYLPEPSWRSAPGAGGQQPHRKRRRHRSTSGRSVSPGSQPARNCATPDAAGSLQRHTLRPSRPKKTLSRGAASIEQQPPAPNAKAISAHCWLIDSSDDQQPSATTCAPTSGRPSSVSRLGPTGGSLTVAVRRQEQQRKQLARHGRPTSQPGDSLDDDLSPVYRDLSMSLKSNSLKMERILSRNESRRAGTLPGSHSFLARPTGSSTTQACYERRECSASSSAAATLTRLSALLSLVSRLVTNRRSTRGSNSQPSSTQANSISGSLGPYTAGSLGISSSSSTSAYATESSTNRSSHTGTDQQGNATDQAVQLRPLRGGYAYHTTGAPGSIQYSLSTPADSLIANSKGNHSYQYCESIQNQIETQFSKAEGSLGRPSTGSSFPSGSSTSSSTSSSQLEALDTQQAYGQASAGRAILSDNELISVGSETGGFRNTFVAPLTTGVSSARRRWWWISMKDLFRRPCHAAGDNQSQDALGRPEPSGPAAASSSQPQAARYKSLHSSRDKPPSAWRNVVSLAKADRVFRIRLIASLIVSSILVGLLALLGIMIYLRANPMFSNSQVGSLSSKLSLLVDDSDYDLSWLWPYTGRSSSQANDAPRLEPISPNEQTDSLLRSNLVLIERSDRLRQLQQTVVHLSNLQLASDSFIDITLLRNRDLNTLAGTNNSQTQRDLAAACLLANLHWPLVKWRHQSQIATVNFLGIPLTSGSKVSSVPENGQAASSQTLRNLLSLLIFAESAPARLQASNQPLGQLAYLADQLWRTSSHLVACSSLNWTSRSSASELRAELELELRDRFCNLLVARYRRMMLRLSILEHRHLARLNDPTMIDPSRTGTGQHLSSRSLVGFLLDRLALLNIDLLAENVLVQMEPRDLPGDGNDLAELFDWLVSVDLSLQSNDRNSWSQSSSSENLLELAKSVVGENPVSTGSRMWPDLAKERRDFNEKQWASVNETMARDLLYPWPSDELPLFAQPINYDLFLHPNLTTHLILGMVKIEFKLERTTRYLVLNVAKLNLVDLSVWLKEPIGFAQPNQSQQAITLRQIAVRRILHDKQREQLYVELLNPIEPKRSSGDDNQTADGPPRANGNEHPSGSFIFGDHLDSSASIQSSNVFMISISFNKTSLMRAEPKPAPDAPYSGGASEAGINFLEYGDFYAQQPESEIKTILFTQFERSNARRLIPCFDEPKFKAKFQLNLVHELNHQVLFNAVKRERVSYTSDGLLQMSVFEWTPIPISTYLVSFVVCDSLNIKSITLRLTTTTNGSGAQPDKVRPFAAKGADTFFADSPGSPAADKLRQTAALVVSQHNGNINNNNNNNDYKTTLPLQKSKHVQVQILAQLEHLGQAEFAGQLVPKLLRFFQSHLRYEYPLDKLDVVAVPTPIQQLGSSALAQPPIDTVESLGLVWFKAQLLLVDANLISQEAIEQVSLIVAHQLAHQYLGNVVGIRAWSDWWLFEALCQLLESMALRQVELEWSLDEQFPVASIRDAISAAQQATLTPKAEPNQSEPLMANQWSEQTDDDSPLGAAYLVQGGDQDKPEALASSTWSSSLLGRRSAVVHMLMLNLLPSVESQTRLLRRLIETHQGSTMSERQFWRLFEQQLVEIDRLGARNSPASYGHPHRQIWQASSKKQAPDLPPARTLRNHANEDLALISELWHQQAGIPLVTVSIHRDRLHLKQEPFSIAWWWSGDRNQPSSTLGTLDLDSTEQADQSARRDASGQLRPADLDQPLWPIPLLFASRFNPKSARFIWMRERELDLSFDEQSLFQLDLQDGSSYYPNLSARPLAHPVGLWFKFNLNQSSMARVNYDERNWEALTELLLKSHYSNHILGPLDRANLLDDALTLMRCGKLAVGLAMNLTMYLETGERDFAPWLTTLQHLDQMQILLNQNPVWNRYVLKLLQPISSVVGWKDDGPHLMRKLRRYLFGVLLKHGDEKTINKAKQEFKLWFKSNRFLVPNLQELVYVAGVRNGDQQEWFHCWQKYRQLVGSSESSQQQSVANMTDSSSMRLSAVRGNLVGGGSGEHFGELEAEVEKRQLLTALASTHNTWLLEQFLNYSQDPTKIETHHVTHVMQSLGKNPIARLYLWRFVRLNWGGILEKLGGLERSQYSPLDRGAFGNTGVIETMIVESTRHFSTDLDYEEVKSFFDSRRAQQPVEPAAPTWSETIGHAVEQSLHNIRLNIYWRNQVEPKLARWLNQVVSSSSIS